MRNAIMETGESVPLLRLQPTPAFVDRIKYVLDWHVTEP